MGAFTLSKVQVAGSILDLESKKHFLKLLKVDTVAATGTDNTNAAQLNYQTNAVTGADGTKGVILPTSEVDSRIVVVNTVSNQTLLVYPDAGGQINALTVTTGGFSLVGGARGEFICDANGHWYVAAANLTGTSTSSSTAELDTLHSVTAGTVSASKAVVVDANKSVDVLQATTAISVGGTGVPGAASVQTEVTKAVTGFADTTAKSVFTMTIPNATHAALVEVTSVAALGAGGAVGAGESSMTTQYLVSVVRRAGVATVAGVSTIIGSAKSKVAGADDITSVVVTTAAVSGANSATQTMDIQVAITRSGAGATNHTGVFTARVVNQNATGITIA